MAAQCLRVMPQLRMTVRHVLSEPHRPLNCLNCKWMYRQLCSPILLTRRALTMHQCQPQEQRRRSRRKGTPTEWGRKCIAVCVSRPVCCPFDAGQTSQSSMQTRHRRRGVYASCMGIRWCLGTSKMNETASGLDFVASARCHLDTAPRHAHLPLRIESMPAR